MEGAKIDREGLVLCRLLLLLLGVVGGLELGHPLVVANLALVLLVLAVVLKLESELVFELLNGLGRGGWSRGRFGGALDAADGFVMDAGLGATDLGHTE